ncbi:DUF4910 domain-containing protein [Aporhodopirellula aestuarii]|uniref:DUF4910 domain-containing protein n=1 Tax=Aporhodopirellula aestuarii TaxID=2950107 RepID=A0ABT0UEH5_9BACT|nr:DUF4910 domain-containing protein [Aporhodopirellula aestuarii]MCM2375141.1 DUF4910 domain-containing protein [Aporhodopirellula aestuarii]
MSGQVMLDLAARLFHLHRSQTGEGVRETFRILSEYIPLEVQEIPSGTRVLDWQIPDEWRIRDASIATADGKRIVDYADSNLHVVNGSRGVKQTMTWSDLESHVFVADDHPDWIPYRTCFFRDEWGFCVTHSQRDRMRESDAPLHVTIDAEYFPGSMSLAECRLDSTVDSAAEHCVLIHCHTCHPSLANDNLSSLVVACQLIDHLRNQPRRYTYRFLFAPATIGPIAWLAQQTQTQIDAIDHGLVLTLLGDSAPLTYKQTRCGDAPIDAIVSSAIKRQGRSLRLCPFDPFGYDERQFSSPGFDLPMGRLSRAIHGEFPEYHMSADNLEFIQQESLEDSLDALIGITQGIESSRYPLNLHPHAEPQLGRYGIFRAFGQRDDRGDFQAAMMWLLNLADGSHEISGIAHRSGLPDELVKEVADKLAEFELIEWIDYPSCRRPSRQI